MFGYDTSNSLMTAADLHVSSDGRVPNCGCTPRKLGKRLITFLSRDAQNESTWVLGNADTLWHQGAV